MRKRLLSSKSNEFINALCFSMRKGRKFLVLLLLVFLLGSSILPSNPNKVYALEDTMINETPAEENMKEYITTEDENFDESMIDIISEVISERTADSKTFKRVDGSYVLAKYNTNVHYKKNGKWVDIDNSLSTNSKNDYFENIANSFNIKFPKTLDNDKSIKMSIDKYEIEWSIDNIENSRLVSEENDKIQTNIKELITINQKVTYENIQRNVNLEYIINSNTIKENIILEKYISNYSISFEYSVKNLALDINKYGNYSFFNDEGIEVLAFDNLYMFDSIGNISNQVKIEVKEIAKNKYNVKILPDEEFLANAKYPVTIDPSVSSLSNDINIYDTYVSKLWSNSMFSQDNLIMCDDGNGWIDSNIAYINFSIPSYLNNFDVTYATLNLSSMDISSSGTVYLRELYSYTDLSTVNWNNKPNAKSDIVEYSSIYALDQTYKLDITNSVDYWNKLNYINVPGFELKSDGSGLIFSSSEGTIEPTIEIGYINKNGIKDFWTYNSQEVGYAGTGLVSDFTQQLYFVRNDIVFQTDLQTLSLGFTYSNEIAESQTTNEGYGKGWNVNYNMLADLDQSDGIVDIVDSSGNVRYFYPDSCDDRIPAADAMNSYTCYISEDGPGDKLVYHGYGSINPKPLTEVYMITKDSTKYTFDKSNGYLARVGSLDNYLEVLVTRNTTKPELVEQVQDYAGNKLVFDYGSDNILDSIVLKTKDDNGNFTELEKVYYKYDTNNEYLYKVYYLCDYEKSENLNLDISNLSNVDKVVKYSNVTGTHKLETASVWYVDKTTGLTYEGEKIKYDYCSNSDNRVYEILSYYRTNLMSKVTYSSTNLETIITDYAGNFVIYKFDRYGNTTNIIDNKGNAIFYEYVDIFIDEDTYKSDGSINYELNHHVNRQYSSFEGQRSALTPNYITNSSLEYINSGWEVNGSNIFSVYSNSNVSGDITTLLDNVLGQNSLKLNGIAKQNIDLSSFLDDYEINGSIFVSAWTNTHTAPNINNANMFDSKVYEIRVKQYDENNNLITGGVSHLDINQSYENWQFIQHDVVLLDGCESIDIELIYDGVGEVVFDEVSLFYKNNSISYEYDDYGRPVKIKKGYGTIYTITYQDTEDEVSLIPETITDSHGNIMYYDSDGGVINSISSNTNNIKQTPTYNYYTGQMEGLSVTNSSGTIEYFSSSTSYDHNSQYISSKEDIFENVTSYYTDEVNGLLEHITNSKNVDTDYEYNEDGYLKKVSVHNSETNETSFVEYQYNMYDQLTDIILETGYGYSIIYDTEGRISSVKVNNNTLMSYEYITESYSGDSYLTNKMLSQEYGNGDMIYFVYNSDKTLITGIDFEGSNGIRENRFAYTYNEMNQLTQYQDITQGIVETYSYDLDGNLIKVMSNHSGIVEYEYDEKGNLCNVEHTINSRTSQTGYNYNNYSLQQGDYLNSIFQTTNTESINYVSAEYAYDTTTEYLAEIEYKVDIYGTLHNVFSVNYLYDYYKPRIKYIRYDMADGLLDENYLYTYEYDSLGNIIEEKYCSQRDSYSQFINRIVKNYTYDDLNQLIREDSRDCDETNPDTYTSSNYTKYYYYDSLGNITDIRSYSYGTDDYFTYSIPSYYQNNYGNLDANVQYNLNKYYDDMYCINIGQTPSLTFKYLHDSSGGGFEIPKIASNDSTTSIFDTKDENLSKLDGIQKGGSTYTPNMRTRLISSNLDTSKAGYYYRLYEGTDDLFYTVRFRIVIKVGNPVNGFVDAEKHISYNYDTNQPNDNGWKDQLDSYVITEVGQPTRTSNIEYDQQGNPTKITDFKYDNGDGNGYQIYNHAILEWEGRTLTKINIYSSSDETVKEAQICYTYNDQGIRIKKEIDEDGDLIPDKRYKYILEGEVLISEIYYEYNSNWIEEYQIIYMYEHDGSLTGFTIYENGYSKTYLYMKNIQGDITKIVDMNGTVQAEYFYDAYGNITYSDSTSSNIAKKNSFTYRSYKYDEEIDMYYLNSRYYNPEIGRFINSDGILGEVGNLQSNNMYAYCANNPVMHIDPTGKAWWHWAIAVGVVVGLAALTIVTAGGATPAIAGFLMASSGLASSSMAVTVLSFATVSSGLALAGVAIEAGLSSNNINDFFDRGEDALFATIGMGVIGSINGYCAFNIQIKSDSMYKVRKSVWKQIANDPKSGDLYRDKTALGGNTPGGYQLHHPYGKFGSKNQIVVPVTTTEHRGIHSILGYGRGNGGFNQYYHYDNPLTIFYDAFR